MSAVLVRPTSRLPDASMRIRSVELVLPVGVVLKSIPVALEVAVKASSAIALIWATVSSVPSSPALNTMLPMVFVEETLASTLSKVNVGEPTPESTARCNVVLGELVPMPTLAEASTVIASVIFAKSVCLLITFAPVPR